MCNLTFQNTYEGLLAKTETRCFAPMGDLRSWLIEDYTLGSMFHDQLLSSRLCRYFQMKECLDYRSPYHSSSNERVNWAGEAGQVARSRSQIVNPD